VAIKWGDDENWYRFEPDQVRYLNEYERNKVGPLPGDWSPDEVLGAAVIRDGRAVGRRDRRFQRLNVETL